MPRFVLVLVGLLPMLLVGCSDAPSQPSASSDVSTPDQASPSATSASERPLTEGSASTAVSQFADDPPASAASSKTEVVAGGSDANASKARKSSPVKAPVAPTPEQIAKWAILDYQPLQLLTCYDGFSDSFVDAMAISPDGKQFVLGGARLTLWNTIESEPIVDLIAEIKGDDIERPIRSVAISPDGNWLAAGDQQGMLRIWSMLDHREVVAIRAHDARLIELAFSPNSQMLATTSYSGEVRLWQVKDGSKIKSLKMSDQEIISLVFLSDQLLASASSEANIWNVESGEKETVLSNGYVMGPALGVSKDRRVLAYTDKDSEIQFWNLDERAKASDGSLYGGSNHTVAYSHDGKWIATNSADSTIRIWDAASRRLVQLIDADGGRTTEVGWLPQGNLLLVASELGRVRIWGSPDDAKSIGLELIPLPETGSMTAETRQAMSSAQLQRVIDVRSFPMLPGAKPQWSQFSMAAYTAPVSQAEAEQFYRYVLGSSGWVEATTPDQFVPGLVFQKENCRLNVSFTPSSAFTAGSQGDIQVSMNFAGNYDVRWLPKYSAIDSKSSYASFSTTGYRTRGSITDVEVSLLKQFHEAGWTGYTRLAASTNEDPKSRTISMLQKGSQLTVTIGYPADSTDELYVQTSASVSNKSLPIPPDAGWIEFDSSTNLQLVANTKLDLDQAIEFYDREMAVEGWLARQAGRHIQTKDQKAWLPYIRGQQDVLIRIVRLPEGPTRVIVGDAERSSWQLAKPPKIDPDNETHGIEAADFRIANGAVSIQFDVDQKQIHFDLPGILPPVLADQYAKQLESLQWTREKSGVVSDDYVLATYTKGKAEIQLRARLADNKNSSVIISGDGLLWAKPLPAPPVRVSYGTWLRRDRRDATLDRLEEFAEEMNKITDVSR